MIFNKKNNHEIFSDYICNDIYCLIQTYFLKMKKFITIFSIVIILALSGFVYFKYFFVFGEGVKSGELNYMVKKGVVFKTFEGKLIQSGFRASSKLSANVGSVQSNEFEFSVVNKGVADTLMLNSGKNMELHYKEYNGVIPWRGFSRYVVDKIISIDNNNTQPENPY